MLAVEHGVVLPAPGVPPPAQGWPEARLAASLAEKKGLTSWCRQLQEVSLGLLLLSASGHLSPHPCAVTNRENEGLFFANLPGVLGS